MSSMFTYFIIISNKQNLVIVFLIVLLANHTLMKSWVASFNLFII